MKSKSQKKGLSKQDRLAADALLQEAIAALAPNIYVYLGEERVYHDQTQVGRVVLSQKYSVKHYYKTTHAKAIGWFHNEYPSRNSLTPITAEFDFLHTPVGASKQLLSLAGVRMHGSYLRDEKKWVLFTYMVYVR